ncbi:hypothetical protein OEA41_001442 [Lepraria neglecta]|uniref:Aminoglycoside phosphotransferase domain-containing protein n=1 Tax=Lepraria neglecta TaxID=209136 RepID=A0AAE0DP13_9LECA|nr:hypothetical protein OEA41_001442 [Lepraria neglecta]
MSVEETTLAQADEDDHRDEWRRGIGKSNLGFLPDDLFFYRDLLPKLCPLPPVSEPLTTMLSHPDISMDNIFVDDAGKLVALIDWARALVEPDILKCWIPESLNEEEAYSTPLGTTGIFNNENNKIFTEEHLDHLNKWSEGGDLHVRSMIEKTKLRAVYEAELRCLNSPLAQVCNRDPVSYDQQLLNRVYWPENYAGLQAFE